MPEAQHLIRVISISAGAALTVALGACLPSTPPSPVPIGAPVSAVYDEFPRHSAYAVVCDRVSWFPSNPQFGECLARTEYIVIFRRGDFQYAYTISGEIVRDVLVDNHTITWP